MKRSIVLLLICITTCSFAYYEDSKHIVPLRPTDLYLMRNDTSDVLWLVQFYNGSREEMANISKGLETAAKSMVDYVIIGAIDVEKTMLTNLVMRMEASPIYYAFYGYYKYMPETLTSLRSIDQIHDETTKQLAYLFEERSIPRFVDHKRNYELGSTDVELKLNKSLSSWAVIYYDAKSDRSKDVANIWRTLVVEFHEKIFFGALNNPIYKIIEDANITYPIIIFYPRGDKHKTKPETYTGKLEYKELYDFFLDKTEEPLVTQLYNSTVAEDCLDARFCIFTFLPNFDNCDYKCRVEALKTLRAASQRYKTRSWTWFWNVFGEQPDVEKIFGVHECSHPMVVVLNVHAELYSKVDLSVLDESKLEKVAQSIITEKDITQTASSKVFPEIKAVPYWNVATVKDEL